ncbi:MAG: ribokinase [Opitutus sp.]
MTPFPQVVVVGSIMQDMIFACDDFPTRGQTIMARLSVGQGGKGSNQAIACGRAGARTFFVGAMGKDSFKDRVQRFYRSERIGCRLVEKPGRSTGTAVILINKDGQNEIVIEPGANAFVAPTDVPDSLFAEAKVVVVQFESNLTTTAHVLRTARKRKILAILNPAPMREDFRPALLKHVDVLIPNESEFVALVRVLPQLGLVDFNEEKLHALDWTELHHLCRRIGVPTVIITLGSKGCFVSQSDSSLFIPAYEGIQAVDTTGAGDAFCGGFAAGLIRFPGDIPAAARFANAVAALSITKRGAADAMPKRRELERFLKQRSYPAKRA